MSRSSKGNKFPFVWIDRLILKGPAYKSLSFSSMIVYLHFRERCQYRKNRTPHKRGVEEDYIIINNGEIVFTYKDADALGISRATFRKALVELQDRGFIAVEQQGYGGNIDLSAPSKYRLIGEWKNWVPPPTEPKLRQLNGAGGLRPLRAQDALPPYSHAEEQGTLVVLIEEFNK